MAEPPEPIDTDAAEDAFADTLASDRTSDPVRADAPDLGPKFAVVRELGRGAMGIVVEARHKALDRFVAAKIVIQDRPSPAAFARFQREARAAGALDHPNIVRVLDFDTAPGGAPFFVMERLTGRDLADRLRDDGPLPLSEALAILRGVGAALDAAHEAGVIHRDLKPANIFVCEDGTAKLLDFGVCHVTQGDLLLTRPGQAIGTPLYMAPEMMRGAETPTVAADVYSLAAIAYEMVTGRPPFRPASVVSLAARAEATRPPAVETLRDDVPPAVGDVLERGLSVDPAARPPSAGALVTALARAAGEEPAADAVPTAAGDPSARASGRPAGRPRWPIAAAAATLAAVVAVIVLLAPWRPPAASDGAAGGAADGASSGTSGGTGDGDPGAVASAVRDDAAGAPPAWPDRPRLLVLPVEGAPERSVDEHLWPLLDRVIVNALDADERLYDSLQRVDPGRVEDEIALREMGSTIDADEARELTALFDADVVLRATVARRDGRVHVAGTLAIADGARVETLAGNDVEAIAAARALAGAVRDTLAPRPDTPPAEALPALLVETPEAFATLAAVADDPGGAFRTRRVLREAIERIGPEPGLVWVRYLWGVTRPAEREALADAAARVDDPALGRLFRALAGPRAAMPSCEALETDVLGRRHPRLIGPLATAVCHHRRGEWREALTAVDAAFADLRLRSLAQPLMWKVRALGLTCDEQLRTVGRVQRLAADSAVGWAQLAVRLAGCGRLDRARELLAVVRAVLPSDPEDRFHIATLAASIELMALDVEGARPWLELGARTRASAEPQAAWFFVESLAWQLQCRPSDARAALRRGCDALADGADDWYTMLVAGLLYLQIQAGELDAAAGLVEEFEAHFPDPADEGNRYMAAMLRLAVARAAGDLDEATMRTRVASLGTAVEQALGPVGRRERDAQECFLYAHLGPASAAAALADRAAPSNRLVAGCLLRRAEQLLAAGEPAAAAADLERAVGDTLWVRFAYTALLIRTLAQRAKALERMGEIDAARQLYRRLVTNCERPEGLPAEVVEARAALTRLGSP